jgi:hypothetical protein
MTLVDRPFIQHVVEFWVGQGVRVFDWILSHLPEEFERFLGTGERWGAEFRYCLVRDPCRPYSSLHRLAADAREGVLLGHADRLPAICLANVESEINLGGPVLFTWKERGATGEEGSSWSGWAFCPQQAWRSLGGRDIDEAGLQRQLSLAAPTARWHEVSQLLSVRTFEDIFESNCTVLRNEFPGLLLAGKAEMPNVRLARSAVIHSSAQIVSPVFIGSGCEVAARAIVGPNVVLGPDCVIDRNTSVANAVLLPGTFVAEGLELDGVVVDRALIIPTRASRPIQAGEGYAVGGLADYGLLKHCSSLTSMALGVVLLLLASPVLLLVTLFLRVCQGGKVWHARQVVKLPAGPNEESWSTFGLWSFCPRANDGGGSGLSGTGLRHFFLEFLPALVNLAKGDIRLVGLPARTPNEVKRLGGDWQAFYLRGSTGIISPTLVNSRPFSREEAYATEGVYAVAGGVALDFSLLFSYLFLVFWPSRGGFGITSFSKEAAELERDSAFNVPPVPLSG